MTPRRLGYVISIAAFAMILTLGAGSTASAKVVSTSGDQVTGLGTVLFGMNEVSGAGNPRAIGIVGISLNQSQGRICWALSVSGVEAPTAILLHAGGAGETGPALLALSLPTADGTATGCAAAESTVMAGIALNPQQYYVNVYSADFPEGAIRGQLM